jgi:hypothetical protein
VAASIDHAAVALFDVLACLDAYAGDDEAHRAMHLREWEEPAPRLHTPIAAALRMAAFESARRGPCRGDE